MTPGPVSDDYPGGQDIDALTIDEVKAIQRERDLLHLHVVSVGQWGFSIAHTESERVDARSGGAPLEDCELHRDLMEADGPPQEVGGVYTVERRQHDGTSESFRSDASRWEWTRLEGV